MTENEKVLRALYRVFGVYPYPQQPPGPNAKTVAANHDATNAFPPINGAAVYNYTNYGQKPPKP